MRPARRALLAGLAATAMAPFAALTQERRVHRLGCLASRPQLAEALRRLVPMGFVEGENLQLEFRDATPDARGLAASAAALVAARPDALLAWNRGPLRALRDATQTIPIVCAGVGDPVSDGLARSLAKPGGNVTGLSYGKPALGETQISLLRSLVPTARRLMVVVAPEDGDVDQAEHGLLKAAEAAGIACDVAIAKSVGHVERAFTNMRVQATHAMYLSIFRDPEFSRAMQFALRDRVATFGATDERPVEQGMLMGSWLDFAEYDQRLAAVIANVLRGANPAEIPFELPERARLAVNRRTAAAIGVRLPEDVMIRATRVFD